MLKCKTSHEGPEHDQGTERARQRVLQVITRHKEAGVVNALLRDGRSPSSEYIAFPAHV